MTQENKDKFNVASRADLLAEFIDATIADCEEKLKHKDQLSDTEVEHYTSLKAEWEQTKHDLGFDLFEKYEVRKDNNGNTELIPVSKIENKG